MAASDLPTSVIKFVRAHIQSVGLLEVLLLLHRDRARDWDDESVAAELRIQPASAKERLAKIESLGLATAAPPHFRFNADSPLRSVVEEVASVYQTHRVSMIELIFSKPPDSDQLFADAFVIKKRKPDA